MVFYCKKSPITVWSTADEGSVSCGAFVRFSTLSLDAKRIERSLISRVEDLLGLLGRHIPQTRQMLRKVLEGPVVCTPFTDSRGKGYEMTASGTYGGLFRVPAEFNNGGGEGGI